MRVLTWCVFVSLAACVKFDEPRAYRCNKAEDCGGWVCLKDGYCHSPDAGARVDCDTAADCTGDWLCGQDHFCRDPNVVGAFACEDDSQCGGAWRCSSERVCVDFAIEPQPAPFLGAADAAVLISPLTTVGDWVRVAPTEFRANDIFVLRGAVVRGTSVEVAVLAAPLQGAGNVGTQHRVYELGRAPTDVALLPGLGVVVWPDGTGAFLREDGSVEAINLPFAATRVIPVVWGYGVESAFVVMSASGHAAMIKLNPVSVVDLGSGVIDVAAAALPDGGPATYVLRDNGGVFTLHDEYGGPGKALFTFDAGAPRELRVEWGHVAVRTDDTTLPPSFVTASAVQTVDVAGNALSPLLSCGGNTLNDFSVTTTGDPLAICGETQNEVIYSLDSQGARQARFLRVSARSAGTSTGHVRQLPEGQLVFSPGIVEDLAEELPEQPSSLGFLGEDLVAINGRMLDRAVPRGFVPVIRTDPDVSNFAGFVDDANLALLEQGAVLKRIPDGGFEYPFQIDLPRNEKMPQGSRARMLTIQGTPLLVVAGGDTLYAGAESTRFIGVARAQVRPSPGFRIDDWVLRPDFAGFVEGWAVANNKLFRITASTESRWKSSELPLTNRDPVGLLEAGAAVLVVDTMGETLALPSRVPVSEPLYEDVVDVASACQSSFLTTVDGVYSLQPATDGGVLSTWQRLAHRPLQEPKLFVARNRVFAADVNGVVLEFPVECP
jgi:hypothetical protein